MKTWSASRGIRTLAALIVAIALAVAPLVVSRPTAAAQPAVQAAVRPLHVDVLSPVSGSVRLARSKAAAAATHLRAKIRVSNPAASLTVQLNGHPLSVSGHGAVRTVALDKAGGLRVGQNLLWVSATARGSETPAQVADRFVVGYPVSDLLTSSGIHIGGGSAPAAALSLEAPLKGVNQTTATLNGKAVQLPPAQTAAGGRRALDLNLAQLGALSTGKNTFATRIVMNDGRVQDLTHKFTLDRRRNIAVARVTGSATVGRLVTLDASGSRLVKRTATDASVGWTLLTRPANSAAHLGGSAGMRSTFTPDQPGVYRVGVRVGSGSNAGYDVLTVAVTYPQAMVPFDTHATVGGKQGLSVGSDFYAYDKNAIQVVVLDRATLAKKVWHSYPQTPSGVDQMASEWQQWLSPDNFIIVATQLASGESWEFNTATELNKKLQEIGGNLGGNWRFENSTCWQGHTFSCTKYDSGKNNTWTQTALDFQDNIGLVGVPGMPAGKAWRGIDHLNGYLTKGVTTEAGLASQYVATNGQADSYEPINTCADVSGSTCAVTVGGKTYSSPGANGFHVVVLRREDLGVVLNTTVTTVGGLHTAINTSTSGTPYDSQNVVHYVANGGQSDARVVIVQSVGNGKLTGAPISYVWQDLSQLGGTPEALDASTDGSHRYALVGVANNLPWRGSALESSTVMDVGTAPGQPTGQIDGMLHRDRTGLYLPTSGSPAGPINSELYAIAFQGQQSWPYAGDPALSYIAENIGLAAYPDVRSAYTNEGTDFGTKAVLLQNLSCTDPTKCANFAAVKKQLLTEFDWVQSVRGFINGLRAPYTQNGNGAVFAAQAIWDDIQNAVPPPPTEDADLSWLGIVTNVVEIASKIAPEASVAAASLSIMASEMDITQILMESADGDDADEVTADSADKLSDELALQQSATVEGIDRMETILLTDYGKLQAVGTKAGGGDADWALTSDTTITSIDALNASTRAQSYSTLMPMTWAGTDLEPSPNGGNEQVTNDVTQYACKSDRNDSDGHAIPAYKFEKALPANQFQALSRVEPDGSTMNDVWTFTQKVSSGTPVVPKDSLTDKIYGPTSRGADGAFQYGPSWWRSTYNPPSGIVCYPPHGDGDDWAPPNIPLPLP